MTVVPHRVVVLAIPPVIGYDLTIPPQVLGEARGPAGEALYDVDVVTVDGRPVQASRGYGIAPSAGPEALATADTVVVPGVHGGSQMTDGTLPADLTAALTGAAATGRMVSICTGAFVLAAAGLLDGRPATTHWMHAAAFSALFPRVALDPGVLFVDDGDVLTSAGNAAGIDLLLHVVRRDHGSDVATSVARRRVVAPWRDGGQAQFVERPLPGADDSGTADTRRWALDRLAEPLLLPDLAGHARMSVRTFTRRFRQETGLSPQRWLIQQRVALARRLLESTDTPVERIATDAGFGTPASLRQHLHAAIGVAPLAYRRTFRGASVSRGASV